MLFKDIPIGDITVLIEQESIIGIGGMIWDASVYMASFLHHNRNTVFHNVKTVVELGAGTGLCGLACALMNPSIHFILTDQAPYLPLLRRNIEVNSLRNVTCEELN